MSDIVNVVAMGTAKPGQVDALCEAVKRWVSASRVEPGCLRFDLSRDIEHPDRLVLIASWANAGAHEAHGRPRTSSSFWLRAIVLCRGFCGVRELLVPSFAERFAEVGYVVVTFDYRGFGSSEGERGRLVPAQHIADIREVVRWPSAQDGVDPDRIGLWGTSLGGCHAISVAAEDPRIGCLVSQMPFADGERIVTGHLSSEEQAGLRATLDKMAERRASTGKEMFVGVTKVLTDPESKEFFEANKARYPAIDIKIPFLTVREMLTYKPAASAPRVTCPTLVVVAEEDAVNPASEGAALHGEIGALAKRLHVERGARHYDVYTGASFENVIREEIAWFDQHL